MRPMKVAWKLQPNAGILITKEKIKAVDLKNSREISAYSNRSINTKNHKDDVIRWSVRVSKNSKAATIGLVNTCKYVKSSFLAHDNIYYGISCRSGNKTKKDSRGYAKWTKFSDKPFTDNTLMTIELNIPKKTISIYHNNTLVGIAYKNVDTDNMNYYLGVVMTGVNDEMEFEKLEIITPEMNRDRIFEKYDQLGHELIECNKVKTVIGSDDIVNLSLKLLNMAKQVTRYNFNEYKEERDIGRVGKIERRLIEWLFPTPNSRPQLHERILKQNQLSDKQEQFPNDLVVNLNEVNGWINGTKEIDSRSDSMHFGSFVDKYEDILQQLNMQKNRLKQTSQKIKNIFRTKSNHSENIKELEKELNKKTTQNGIFAQSAEKSLTQLNEIRKEIANIFKKYQALRTTHEKSAQEYASTQKEINTTQQKLTLERNKFNQ